MYDCQQRSQVCFLVLMQAVLVQRVLPVIRLQPLTVVAVSGVHASANSAEAAACARDILVQHS